MGYGIKLKVWGKYACFTRPEMKAERVSYDVITPSAARGILEAIHWKPSIRWVVDRIHVLNEIRFESIRRNEVENKISENIIRSAIGGLKTDLHQYASEERQQRATLMLKDVAYVIEAHFEMVEGNNLSETPEKHYNIFLRRARSGQCYHRPYFGCREFPVFFKLLESEEPVSKLKGEKDLGWVLYDIDYKNNMIPRFYRPAMSDGIIEVPHPREVGCL